MRTVDPVLWSRKVEKRPMAVARPWRYRISEGTAFERRLRTSLADAMHELMRNCSVEGVASIVDKRNPKLVRYIYIPTKKDMIRLICDLKLINVDHWNGRGDIT